MALIDSLPPRPLEPQELTSLNRSDSFQLVVAVESDGPARGVLFATETWVKGVAYEAKSGWTLVETVEITDDVARIDGLQACEAAIVSFQDAENEA